MLRLRTSGPYRVPDQLVLRVQRRHVTVLYPAPPALCVSVRAGWALATAQAVSVASRYVQAPACDAVAAGSWQRAGEQDGAVGDGWRQSGVRDALQRDGWNAARAVSARALAASWGKVPERDVATAEAWQPALPTDGQGLRASWQIARPTDAASAIKHQDCDRYSPEWLYREALPPYIPNTQPVRLRFNRSRYIPGRAAYFQFGRDLRSRPLQPRDQRVGVAFNSARVADLAGHLRWGAARPMDPPRIGITYPDYNGPVIIIEPPAEPDIQDTYMIVNQVGVVVLPERVPLDVSNIRIALDIDSYSWSFSCDLQGQTSLNLVKPDVDGQKQLEVDINGWTWVFVVERYKRSHVFPSEKYSITGASRTQLLAAPYASKRSAVNTVEINARQAAEEQLLYTGFTLEWDSVQDNPVDWTIPAGALSYQDQTPMEIIARIAQAAGAVVRPSRDADELQVLPRYREAVWYWNTAIVDRVLPADIITSLDGEWSPQPKWNSCYVSGTNFGVAVDVRRAGTAADNPAADVYDDLITATNVARARGVCEISKGGDIEIVGKTLPLFPPADTGNPGLVLPAMLCEVRGDGDTWRGLCLSTEISASGVGGAKVVQSLRLERHTGEQ